MTPHRSPTPPRAGFALTFLVVFSFYLAGLAPGVTLEDSGEFITAAVSLGVPHPPGYPLWTMLAAGFVRLGFDSPAFALNLFSALLSALAASVLFLAIHKMLSLFQIHSPIPTTTTPPTTTALLAFVGASLAALAPSVYRQSIITEVYGLHSLITASLLLLMMTWISTPELSNPAPHRNRRLLITAAFLGGLGVSNHHLTLIYAPLILLLLLLFPRTLKALRLRDFFYALLALVLGLLPYLYLPWASSHRPTLAWGLPHTWQQFYRVVTRAQYAPKIDRSLPTLVEQLREQVVLLMQQYPAPLIFVGLLALFVLLFLRGRRLGVFLLASLLVTGPMVALMINFDIPLFDPLNYEVTSGLLSVFFIGHYQIWGFLFAFIGLYLWSMLLKSTDLKDQPLSSPLKWALSALLLALVLGYGYRSFQLESQRGARFAEDYFENLDVLASGKPALILTNWDPFFFPPLYFQSVEKRQLHLSFFDFEMAKGPWYLEHFKLWQPELYRRAKPEIDSYIKDMNELLGGARISGAYLAEKYFAVMNAIIEAAYEDRPIYLVMHRGFTTLPQAFSATYAFVPQLVAARLVKKEEADLVPPPPLREIQNLKLSGFTPHKIENDRMVAILSTYYTGLFLDNLRQSLSGESDGSASDLKRAELLYEKAKSLNTPAQGQRKVLEEFGEKLKALKKARHL